LFFLSWNHFFQGCNDTILAELFGF